MPGQPNYALIIEGFLVGEKTATRQIVEFINLTLLSWRENTGQDADDIRSDVLYKLLISLRKDEIRDKSKLRAFIGTLVKRTCLEYRRYAERFKKEELDNITLPDKAFSPEQSLEKSQFARLNYRIMRRITRECRELWRLYLKQGLNYAEIAEKIGHPVGTIKWKFSQCRKKVQEIMQKIMKNDQPF